MCRGSNLTFFALLILAFFEPAIPQQPNNYEFFTGDFDGDGTVDFIRRKTGEWATDGIDTAEIYYGNNNRTFTRKVLDTDFDLVSAVSNLFVADFNGDGKDDILRQKKGADAAYDTFRNATNTCFLLLSTGQDFLKIVVSESYFLNGERTSLVIGDYDGDGKADIFRMKKTGDNSTFGYRLTDAPNVLFGSGSGGFTSKLPAFDQYSGYYMVNYSLTNFFAADFDGDGRDDLFRQEKGAWAQDRLHTACLLTSEEVYGTFSLLKTDLPEIYDLKGDYTDIFFADFNGDGHIDILRRDNRPESENSGAYIFISIINGTFYPAVLPDSLYIQNNNTRILIGDFNGDGTDEFLRQTIGDTSNTNNTDLQIFTSSGTYFVPLSFSRISTMNGNVSQLVVGDFDGDGIDDILQALGVDRMYAHFSVGKGKFDSRKIV